MSAPTPLHDGPATHDAVLDEVARMIAAVVGEDYVTAEEITPETAFYDDLEIESIEFIALGEVLQARYGARIDFPAWIATMEVDDIIAMRVGQLVDHIVASLSGAAGDGGAARG
jgi:acyl carrier protein